MNDPVSLKTLRFFLVRSPLWRCFAISTFALGCFALAPQAQAACQEGCFTNGNTALGDDALLNRNGIDNTAVGLNALKNNGGTANFNTAIGFVALTQNTSGEQNTATGVSALRFNSTGNLNTANGVNALFHNNGGQNTATGVNALFTNSTGNMNTANGVSALFFNTTGTQNTAIGVTALRNNDTGSWNVAIGNNALYKNVRGTQNTAVGVDALHDNQNGFGNVAIGFEALKVHPSGVDNVAIGHAALRELIRDGLNGRSGPNVAIGSGALSSLDSGVNNIGLGWGAGSFIGGFDNGAHNNNIDIGSSGSANDEGTIRIGEVDTHTSTYIAGISNAVVDSGDPVIVAPDGNLGVAPSSARFKEAINPMDKTSESIFLLEPVTFRYKKEIGRHGVAQFGLVAEEVEKVNPDLVNRDKEGKPFSVRYEAVNAMLLNEFLKEHRKVEELECKAQKQEAAMAQQQNDFKQTIAQQQNQIEALTATVQKVSEQIEINKPASRLVTNNP